MKKISVIVPVYNGEKYIKTCLDSILAQTQFDMSQVEILLINDGSKDGSIEILGSYARKYPTIIRLIDQPNMGAANTRNKGIGLSTGEYIMFIDQDDTVDVDYCKTFYDAAKKGNYDVVIGGFKLVNRHGSVTKTKLPPYTEFGKYLMVPAWAKAHRTAFLKEKNISFFDNNIGEDNVFLIEEIVCTENWGTVKYAGYNNSYDNSDNVTNAFHKGLSEKVNIIALLDRMLTIQSEKPATNELLTYDIVRTITYYLLSYGRNADRERFLKVYEQLFAWLDKNMPDYKKNRYVRLFAPAGESLSASVGIKGFIFLHKLHLVEWFVKVYCKG